MTLAKRLFDAQRAYGKIEDELSYVLDQLYGQEALEVSFDFTFDAYDDSIEIYGVTPSTFAWSVLREHGFRLIWQHDHARDDAHGTVSTCACPSVPFP